MLQKIQLENFCQHENLQWTSLQNINLIIGENSSGKTVLLKVLYALWSSMVKGMINVNWQIF